MYICTYIIHVYIFSCLFLFMYIYIDIYMYMQRGEARERDRDRDRERDRGRERHRERGRQCLTRNRSAFPARAFKIIQIPAEPHFRFVSERTEKPLHVLHV